MNINLLAPINSMGYGVVGLNVALALRRSRHAVALWVFGAAEAPQEHHAALRDMLNQTASYDRLAPSLRIFQPVDLAMHVGKGPHCAMPTFELNRFRPVELHHLNSQDFIFATSHWAVGVLEANGLPRAKIGYAPHGVDLAIFNPQSERPHREGTPTVFLNIGKWETRKGQDVLLKAFNAAFEPADHVELVLNCFNPFGPSPEHVKRYNDEWIRTCRFSKLGDKIVICDGRLATQKDVAALMAGADCGVFPARAEGWGMGSSEMLAMGKHIILTDYSGHTDYANDANAMLIKIDSLENAQDAHDPAWDGSPGQWAALGNSQVDQLIAHLREVHRRKQSGTLGINTAGIDTMKQLTWDNTAAKITSALAAI